MAPLSLTRWARAQESGVKIRMVATLPEECSARKDPKLGSWWLKHEVLRDIAAYWLNAVEQGNKERKVSANP